MNSKWKNMNMNLDFLNEEEAPKKKLYGTYKLIISDDDPEVHAVTKMILRDFEFEGHSLVIIDSYSGEETKEALRNNADAAILFQDVVMESNHTGLEIIEYLRNTLNNQLTRVVLRTGQPGEAPEEKVIKEYEINDYCLKTELTMSRLITIIISALRNYRDIVKLDKYRKGLEKIIETSADLFTHNSLTEFLTSILEQLSGFYIEKPEIMYIRDNSAFRERSGFVALGRIYAPVIVAATGKYEEFIGKNIELLPDFNEVSKWIYENSDENSIIDFVGSGFIIKNGGTNNQNNYIFIEGDKELYDFDLIKLFLANYSVALDNHILRNMIFSTQKELIETLGEMVDNHFDETGGHVKIISTMMYKFAQHLGFSYGECEKLKVASTMHDIGKIGIPDSILKKPGRLTADEFEIVKGHSKIGHRILSKSELEILQMSADIALYHHEKYDGTGYPEGLPGQNIPLYARMLAIVDVFDALSHKRIYKEASSIEETLEYLKGQRGKHFDPKLLDVFLQNFKEIAEE